MTPAELITRNFRDLLSDNFGATLSVYSLLVEALDGEVQFLLLLSLTIGSHHNFL